MSAVVYDVGYDIRMIKTRKNMVTVRLLAAIKEKELRKTQIAQKISRFRSTLPYLSSEYRNVIPYRCQSQQRPRYRILFQRAFLVSIFNSSLQFDFNFKKNFTELIHYTNRFKQKQVSFSIQFSFKQSLLSYSIPRTLFLFLKHCNILAPLLFHFV